MLTKCHNESNDLLIEALGHDFTGRYFIAGYTNLVLGHIHNHAQQKVGCHFYYFDLCGLVLILKSEA